VGRAPWPVTVVLRLVSPGAKQVGRPEENRHLRVVIEWAGFQLGMWILFAEVQGGCSNHSIFLFVLRGFQESFFFP